MVDRPLHHRCSLGAVLGTAGSRSADRAPYWPRPRLAGPGPGRVLVLERLGARFLCIDSLRHYRADRRLPSATLPHETHGPGSHVGLDSDTPGPGNRDSVLGSAAGRTFAGCGLCLQGTESQNRDQPIEPITAYDRVL